MGAPLHHSSRPQEQACLTEQKEALRQLIAQQEALGPSIELMRARVGLLELEALFDRHPLIKELRLVPNARPTGLYINACIEWSLGAQERLFLSRFAKSHQGMPIQFPAPYLSTLMLAAVGFRRELGSGLSEMARRALQEAIDKINPPPGLPLMAMAWAQSEAELWAHSLDSCELLKGRIQARQSKPFRLLPGAPSRNALAFGLRALAASMESAELGQATRGPEAMGSKRARPPAL